MNEYYKDKYVWITGASSGLGRALALSLRQLGAHVAISGRNTQALNELAKALDDEKTMVLPFDVTQKAAHSAAAAQIQAKWGRIDLAILNAGVSDFIDLNHFADGFEPLIQINLLGVVYGIDVLLKLMLPANAGHIAVMSSMAGFRGLPQAQAYCASKAGVRSVAQGLVADLKDTGVSVTSICPGFVKTPLTDKNDFPMPFLMSPEKAAGIILKRLVKKPVEICFPWPMSFFVKLLNLLPLTWYLALAKRAR